LLASHAAKAADVTVQLKDHRFSPAEIKVPHGEAIILTVHNLDQTPAEFESNDLKVEKVVAGNSKIIVKIRPLKPGAYGFFDEYHEDVARGRLIAQ
jgi:hypothetical protein